MSKSRANLEQKAPALEPAAPLSSPHLVIHIDPTGLRSVFFFHPQISMSSPSKIFVVSKFSSGFFPFFWAFFGLYVFSFGTRGILCLVIKIKSPRGIIRAVGVLYLGGVGPLCIRQIEVPEKEAGGAAFPIL